MAVFGGMSDEQHSHATLVGPEGQLHPSMPGRQRALSHSGALTLDGVAGAAAAAGEGEETRPPLATTLPGGARREQRGHRRAVSELPLGGGWGKSSAAEEEGEEDDEQEERGRRSPLIDLSEGVENPWHGSRSRADSRTSLHIDIPAFPSSAASARMRSNPPSQLRRTASGHSVDQDGKRIRKVPSILLTSASGDESLVQPSSIIPPGRFAITHRRGYRIARAVFLALFPSLQDFREKSWVGRGTAILCVPAILLLNLTLPVVDSEADDCASLEEKEAREEEDASGDVYRDYDSEDEDEDGLAPREGILVDTDDITAMPPHPPSHHHTTSEVNRHHREEAARALHGRVLPHAELIDGVEVPSPWVNTPAHSPLPPATTAEEDVQRSFAQFSMASENGTVNHVRSSTEGTDGSDGSAGKGEGGGTSQANLEVHANVLTRWLTAVQCTLGPVFCVTALLGELAVPCGSRRCGCVATGADFRYYRAHQSKSYGGGTHSLLSPAGSSSAPSLSGSSSTRPIPVASSCASSASSSPWCGF